MDDKTLVIKRVYLSYRDDDESIVNGYFDIISETDFEIKFKTKASIVTISKSRLLKMKESLT